MTKSDLQAFRRLVGILRKAEALATRLGAVLDNGAEVDSLIGSMADEIELKCDAVGPAQTF